MAVGLNQLKSRKSSKGNSTEKKKVKNTHSRKLAMPWDDLPNETTDSFDTLENRDNLETFTQSNPIKNITTSDNRDNLETTSKELSINADVDTTVSKSSISNNQKSIIFEQTNDLIQFASLSGLRRKLILQIFYSCKANREKVSEPLTMDYLIQRTGGINSSIKKTLQRLEKQNYIKRISFRRGRGGWSTYELNDVLYKDILLKENEGKLLDPISNLNRDNLETSNSVQPELTVPKDWVNIVIPETLQNIGFRKHHIEMIYKAIGTKFSSEEIENSLEQFSYDLENNFIKVNTSPIRFLMGVLIKHKTTYTSEKQLEALNKDLSSYTKKIKELEKAKKEYQEALEHNQFEIWLNSLDQNEMNQIIPPSDYLQEGSAVQISLLKAHWQNNIKLVSENI